MEPILFEIGGEEYKVEQLTGEIDKIFEKYLSNQVMKAMRFFQDTYSEKDYTTLLEKHLFRAQHHDYAIGTPVFQEYIQKDEHFVQLMFICFKKHNSQVSRVQVKEWVEAEPQRFVDLFLELMESKKNSPKTSSSLPRKELVSQNSTV